jgi:hypothetical protein
MWSVHVDRHLEIRKPLDQLEAELVRRQLLHPTVADIGPINDLRYALSFARLTEIRAAKGTDVEVAGLLAPHRWRVLEGIRPRLEDGGDGLGGVLALHGDIVASTRAARKELLDTNRIDRDSLEAEVTIRKLVVVAGGGGGSGYGYSGAFTLLHRRGLQPEMIVGTSMGALMGLFRARFRAFDGAAMVEAAKRLKWQKVFRVLDLDSRYGLPATLRLYLRAAIGHLFQNRDGEPMRFCDLGIPMLVVVTGITLDALKHDLAWYEHFLDDAVDPGQVLRGSRLKRVMRVIGILKEMMSAPDTLREVVFGRMDATHKADVIDVAGFSSAIPGIIHYDIYRSDDRMRRLLDQLYAEHGITRLLEGGLVNNLPCRPAYEEVMSGRLGRRNAYVLAMDCFSPGGRGVLFYPVQQLVRANVVSNLPFAHHVFNLNKRLNPLNLVPKVREVETAMNWTMDELEPDIVTIQAMCATLPVLSD